MDESLLIQFLKSSIPFLSIGFAILVSLPRLRSWLRRQFDIELRNWRGQVPAKTYLSYTYYLKLAEWLDIAAVMFLIGGFLVLLVPLELTPVCYVYGYTIFVAGMTIFRIAYAAYFSINETLKHAKIVFFFGQESYFQ